VGGCESGHIAVDPRDPNIVYSGCFGGSISRYDVRTGQTREILAYPQNQLAQRVGDLRYRFQWNAPIRISPHDPDVLYHASNHLHRSRTGGQSWEVVSPDLTTNNPDHQGFAGGPITSDGTGVEVYGTIFAFEESPDEPGVLWTGSDDGLIHVSRDNGENWTNVTPPDFPEGATVNAIDISRHAPGRIHVAAYKYRQDDMRPYVFRTDDYGASWQLLTTGANGIPADHFVRVVREDPERRGLLYVGTEFGMYASFDDGAHWQSLQRNLPFTPITDIQVHQGDLVLSTQGRSFWIMDDLTPLRVITEDVAAATATLHDVRPTYRAFFGGPGLGALGASSRATNPPDGAWFHYTLGENVEGSVKLTVLDAVGDTATTLSSEAQAGPDLGAFAELAAMFGFGGGGNLLPKTAGTHRGTWDLTLPAPRLPAGTIIFGTVGQPPAPPGQYTVTLTVNDEAVDTKTFEVLPDPRVPTTQADYVAQHEFLKDLGQIINRVSDRADDLLSVRAQVEGLVKLSGEAGLSDEDVGRVKSAADSLTGNLTGLQEEIQQTDNRSFYDPLDNPGKLAAELAFLYNTVAGSLAGAVNDRPTDQAVERLGELRGVVGDVIGRLDSVLDEDLSAFNDLIRELGMDPVVVARTEAIIS
ncbi:MAG: WD40/YVTN/BNR-like repeat-containing protein, partial [Longimicrobiales bacterium]